MPWISRVSEDGVLICVPYRAEKASCRITASIAGYAMHTPPAQAVGFKLRLKAGSVGTKADGCRYTT